MLTKIASSMGVSATLGMNMRSNALQQAGKKVYKFGFGQSPFPVPYICQKAFQQNVHQTQYSSPFGLPELRKAIVNVHNTIYKTKFSADNVLISPGSKELLLLLQYVLQEQYLIPAPAWVSHINQPKMLGSNYKLFQCKKENNLKITGPELSDSLKKYPNNCVVLLNTPNNPTGQVYSAEEYQALAKVAKKQKVMFACDEIYNHVEFEGKARSLSEWLPDDSFCYSGMSKWAGSGGWRLGYLLIPEKHMKLKYEIQKMAENTFEHSPTPIQYGTIPAYREFFGEEIQTYLKNSRKILKLCAQHVEQTLAEVGVETIPAKGGFYNYPIMNHIKEKLKAKKGITDSKTLGNTILDECGVAMLSSVEFGRDPEELGFRLSYVDFDGENALKMAQKEEVDMDFIKKHCNKTYEGAIVLADWISKIMN